MGWWWSVREIFLYDYSLYERKGKLIPPTFEKLKRSEASEKKGRPFISPLQSNPSCVNRFLSRPEFVANSNTAQHPKTKEFGTISICVSVNDSKLQKKI